MLKNPFLRRTVGRSRVVLRSGSQRRAIVNRNTLVRSTSFVHGVKTGHTSAAGYVLVGSASKAGVSLVSVVMGTPSEAARNADTLALLRFGFGRYRRATALRRGAVLARPAIRYRGDETLEVVASRAVQRVARRGERLRLVVDAPAEVEGPVDAGARIGTVAVVQRGRTVARVALVAARAVPEAGVARRLRRLRRPRQHADLALHGRPQ